MTTRVWAAGLVATGLLVSGCKSAPGSGNDFKKTIDNYYAAHPSCIWEQPRQFPVQVDAKDLSKTAPYDALFDQNLLTRTAGDKKKLLGLVDKQISTYDLSETGKTQMTQDATQPGFVNFCYGHRVVQAIDATSVDSSKTPQTATVTYHYTFNGVPPWTSAPEVQNTYPAVHQAAVGPVSGTAQLVNSSNGWSVVPSGQVVE